MWRDFSLTRRSNAKDQHHHEGHNGASSPSSTTSSFGSYQTKSNSEFHKNNVPQLQMQSQQQQQQLQRNSYSLPHPAHLQSNARWQNLHAPSDPHQQQQQAMLMMHQRSTLMHSPSYPHIPSANPDQHLLLREEGGGGRGGKPRPVSMYDMPPPPASPSSGGGGFSFIPSILMPNRGGKGGQQQQQGFNGSPAQPASLQHPAFYGRNQQQLQQVGAPKKGQIMRQGPGELVRTIVREGIEEE